MLTCVNWKSIKSVPTLWVFGGGVVTTPEGRRDLEEELGATDFSGDNGKPEDSPYDLRFWLPKSNASAFDEWLERNEPSLQIVQDVRRELREECKNHGLPKDLAGKIRFGGYTRKSETRDTWSYQGTKIPQALCYDYVVSGSAPEKVAEAIRHIVATSENLYLITRDDIQKGSITGVIGG